MSYTFGNAVIIRASRTEVEQYLIQIGTRHYRLNMAKLFPEQFPASDPTGYNSWTTEWFAFNTGTSTLPDIVVKSRKDGATVLHYDTEHSPNYLTLQRLHQLTTWPIEHRSQPPLDDDFEVMTCQDGVCSYQLLDEPYQPLVSLELPEAWNGLLSQKEFLALFENDGHADRERMAVFQSISKPGAKDDVIFMPVAIDSDDMDWAYGLVIRDNELPQHRIQEGRWHANDIRQFDLVRHTDWQPQSDNWQDELDLLKKAFWHDYS